MKAKRLIVTLICLVQTVLFSVSYSKDYYVKVGGTGDGSSWEKAMSGDEFAKILPTAYDGSTFYLAEGSYQPCPSFTINSSVKIVGGFSNNAELGDKNDPDKYPTIMNALYNGSTQMLFMDGDEPISLTLEGLRMKYASIAVLFSEKGKLFINNCVIDSTSIITPNIETVEISNTKFSNIREGSSVYKYPMIIEKADKVLLSNVTFSNIGGDVIYANSTKSNFICDSLIMKDVTVRNTNGNLFSGDVHYGLFENLDAESKGINVLNSSDEIIIRDSKLTQTGLTGSGNGIYFAEGKKLSVIRSSILGYQNGILDDYSKAESVISLDDVTILCKNSEGVALYLINEKSDVVVNNSSLLDAEYGVELVYGNSLTVKNSMISGNSECGIYVVPGRTTDVYLENNIIGLTRNADERYPNKVGVYACANNFTAKDNIVSGNDSIGMHFFTVYKNIELSGNYIGTNRKFEDFGNGSTGIVLLTECASSLDMAPKNLESANYIGYNGGDGVHAGTGDLQALSSTIRNNYIGVTPEGVPMPNKGYGFSIEWNSYPYRTETSELYVDHNHFGYNKLGDIKETGAYALISQNVFHGNSEKAIEMSRSVAAPTIYEVKVENEKYVLYGSVTPDPRNSAAVVTVELYCTNNEKESALKYIASVNANEDNRFSFVVDDMPDVDSETSCFVAIAIYNEDPIYENRSYTTELSDPYCVCTPAPVIIEKSVTIGTSFTVENRTFYPKEEGYYEEVLTSEDKDGCRKKTIVRLTVTPGKIPHEYYVKVDGTGDGSSWENAMSGAEFTSICGTVPDSTIFYLAEGDYEPMKAYGYSGFYLNSDINIIGGYPADAKTGAKREKGKYSTIDASGLGVKSYLFRRLNYSDTLNIYLEGLAMKNVMNAIEGDPGSRIIVEDCLFDNAPLVFSKSSHVEINNSTIRNITAESEIPCSIDADSVAGLIIRNTQFKAIEGNVFTPSSYVDSVTMESVGVEAKTIQLGGIGAGTFGKVASSAELLCERLVNGLRISESSFPKVSVKTGRFIKIAKSVIEGEGVDVESDSVVVDNTRITNKVAYACLHTKNSRVKVKRSILSGGSHGVSYLDGSVDIEDSYIYSNTKVGIASGKPTGKASAFMPLILKNNHIGVNERGEVAGNKIGVSASASKLIVTGNIISGNDSTGIEITDADEVTIENNYIGTDEQYRNLGNGGCGIDLHKSIGGGTGSVKLSPSSFDKANVIGFNGGDGVIVSTSTQSDESFISHNYIGVAPDGTKIPNKGYGVRIESGYEVNNPANLVENHMGYNEAGDVSEGFPFKISKNIFHGNESKAIDKSYATFYSNFDPVIKSVSVDGDNYVVTGVTAEHAIVDVELYGTNDAPQSALVYLGTVQLSTSDLGDFSFTVPIEQMSQDSLTCFVATVWSESYRFTTELSAPYCLCGESRDTITSTEDGCTKVRIESFSYDYSPSLNSKDILELVASPNPAKPGEECEIIVTLKSKKDVNCDVYGLNGGASDVSCQLVKADMYAWEGSESNYICRFKVSLKETSVVRVRTATDAASVVVLVNQTR